MISLLSLRKTTPHGMSGNVTDFSGGGSGMPNFFQLVLITLLAVGIAYAGYGFLPSIGIETFSKLATPTLMFALIGLSVASVAFIKYLKLSWQHPSLYLLAYLIVLPWFTWITRLSTSYGVNFPQSYCLGFLFCIPVALLVKQYAFAMLAQISLVRFYAIFWFITLLNIIFNNHIVYDATALVGKQSMSVHDFTTFTLTLFTLFLTGYVVYRERDILNFLKAFNWSIIFMTIFLSVVAILCYPLHIFTVKIEGMYRMGLIFFHPNHFAMYLTFMMLYLVGIYFYQVLKQDRHMDKFLIAAICIGFPALLTTATKSAIGALVVVSGVTLLFNLTLVKRKKFILVFLAVLPVLLVVALVLFQLVTQIDILEKFLFRLDDNRSMEWRWHTWAYIFGDIDWSTVFTGHGFSAASERMDQFQTIWKQGSVGKVLQVHNDYLMLLYDFGVVGLTVYFWLIASMLKKVFSIVRTPAESLWRTLDITFVSLILAYLVFSSTDNCYVMLETPFWITLLTLYIISGRLKKQSLASNSQADSYAAPRTTRLPQS